MPKLKLCDFEITEEEFQENMKIHDSGVSMRNIVCTVTNKMISSLLSLPMVDLCDILMTRGLMQEEINQLYSDDELRDKIGLLIDAVLNEIDIENGEEILPIAYRDYDIDKE